MKNKFVFLFLLTATVLFGKEKTDILFYLQDAGETYALLPVIRKLHEQGIDCRVLVAGVAEELAQKSGVPQKLFLHFSDLKIEAFVDKNWSRSQKLSKEEISLLFQEIEAKEFVSGVAYELQGQMIEGFSQRKVPTFAYWDNLNAVGDNPYFQTAHSVEAKADILLLPSFSLEKDFANRQGKKVVGQPTLEEWKARIATLDRNALRQKLGVKENQKAALFIGGYGAEYEEAFRLFMKGISKNGSYFFFIQPHPKTNGSFEQGLNGPALVLNGEWTTLEAVAAADIVICHQSTVAFQALAAGKAVLNVIPDSQRYDSLPLQKGLAKRVSQAEELTPLLEKAESTSDRFYDLMEIPENSVDLTVSLLLEALFSRKD